MPQLPLDNVVIELLKSRIADLENALQADVISLYGPIQYGTEKLFRQALETTPTRRNDLAVILDSPGGIVEVVERMVQCARHLYTNVLFIVPDKAMSAGTVFAMSGDRILMNYASVLGPIDPQILKDGKFTPALAYLSEYEALVDKSTQGTLTTVEYGLMMKFDLGELHTFKQARDLSVDLVKRWLSNYKFKNWTVTETGQIPVTQEMREQRAKEVADKLVDHTRWHSHGRCININALNDDLKIKIEDYAQIAGLGQKIHDYFDVFADFLTQKGFSSFIHSRYFI